MPNVSIGDNAIIGAGAIVTKSIPSGEVWGGVPAKYICKCEHLKNKYENKNVPVFDESYTIRGKITNEKKIEMINILSEQGIGLIK